MKRADELHGLENDPRHPATDESGHYRDSQDVDTAHDFHVEEEPLPVFIANPPEDEVSDQYVPFSQMIDNSTGGGGAAGAQQPVLLVPRQEDRMRVTILNEGPSSIRLVSRNSPFGPLIPINGSLTLHTRAAVYVAMTAAGQSATVSGWSEFRKPKANR